MDPLLILTHITLVLLFGLLCTLVANKFGISNVLLLLMIGIFLGNLEYYGDKLIVFPELFITSVGVMALVMIVFDSTSRFKLREFDSFSWRALKLSIIFLILCIIILSFAVKEIFGIPSNMLAVIFALLMSGTDPSVVFTIFKGKGTKVSELLKVESIINTPLVVILPFIVLDVGQRVNINSGVVLNTLIEQLPPFLLKFIVGIGTGVFVGIFLLRIMKKHYSDQISPLAILITTLLTYVLAENLDGSGVLAVTTLGLMFGNTYVKKRFQLQEFSAVLSMSLQILVFVLVGFMIKLDFSYEFFIKSLLLFVIYLGIRFLALQLSFPKDSYNLKEKLFMTLNVSKGIAVAVMTLTLASMSVFDGTKILDLTLVFLLYSLILSSFVAPFAKRFVEVSEQKN